MLTLPSTRGASLEEKQAAIERLAASIAPPSPPVPPVPEALRRELRRAVDRRSKPAEEIRMVYEGLMLVEPKLVPRVDEKGHPYWGPSDETYQALRSVLEFWG